MLLGGQRQNSNGNSRAIDNLVRVFLGKKGLFKVVNYIIVLSVRL